ncbi:hypothetical protein KSP40_PGU021249 [Platanthera guangdongensis]|uniref:Uncharacterized protein n=1 Tax=Platanthera guangdongensis TaxID=2320717 RepID=A0ABR2LKH7_9ASPA
MFPPGKLLIEREQTAASTPAVLKRMGSRGEIRMPLLRIDDLEKEARIGRSQGKCETRMHQRLQDQELQSGRESLVVEELKYKLNKLGKHYVVLLAEKYEVEDDKRKIQKDKENLNILYNRLQNLNQELIRKRDLLLSLPQLCKNCNIIFNETESSSLETLGAEHRGDIQNESHDLFSTTKRSGPRPNKRRRSIKAVVMEAGATLEGILKEIELLPGGGLEDLEDAYEERKLNLVNSDKKGGNGEKQDLLSHASGATNSSVLGNEGHHKRQKTSDIGICCHGQKHYNLRPSTM